jgi:hypothetical protein
MMFQEKCSHCIAQEERAHKAGQELGKAFAATLPPAALENKPDPRVVELEAEVARLRGALEKIARMDVGDAGAIAERALSDAPNGEPEGPDIIRVSNDGCNYANLTTYSAPPRKED